MKFQDSSKLFFTSDLHLFHDNCIKYCNRPFVNVDEMNSTIIANWNNKIKPDDSVFLLGDLSFGKPEQTETILKELNGNIYLIRGNHDHPGKLYSLSKYFTFERDLVTIEVPDVDIQRGFQPIVLCHYALLSWDRQHYGSWMLHGHAHGNISFQAGVKRLDVGVDVHNFTPISYQEIKDIMNMSK